MLTCTKFKGTESKYILLHQWVAKQLGRPSHCVDCGATEGRKFQWANISGEYRKDLLDWERLCQSCHQIKDGGGLCRKKIHKLTGDNIYIHPSTGRRCVECKKQYRKEYYWRNK